LLIVCKDLPIEAFTIFETLNELSIILLGRCVLNSDLQYMTYVGAAGFIDHVGQLLPFVNNPQIIKDYLTTVGSQPYKYVKLRTMLGVYGTSEMTTFLPIAKPGDYLV
jgi:hypothetical protein